MCGWGAIVVNDKAEFAISSVSWVESCWLRRRNDACRSAKVWNRTVWYCGWGSLRQHDIIILRGMMLKKKIRQHGWRRFVMSEFILCLCFFILILCKLILQVNDSYYFTTLNTTIIQWPNLDKDGVLCLWGRPSYFVVPFCGRIVPAGLSSFCSWIHLYWLLHSSVAKVESGTKKCCWSLDFSHCPW